MIVLHEIYGVNEFIKSQCRKLKTDGFDVFCPNLINKSPFAYGETQEAYAFFMKNVGFNVYKRINCLVSRLKENYDDVFILGFSVGATIAWRCCENSLCSGLVACYGSRIRDYTGLNPVCPTLLLISKENFFDVREMICQLQNKKQVTIAEYDAPHGFLDFDSEYYDARQAKNAENHIARFLGLV